jgi:hypothetical protein
MNIWIIFPIKCFDADADADADRDPGIFLINIPDPQHWVHVSRFSQLIYLFSFNLAGEPREDKTAVRPAEIYPRTEGGQATQDK